MAKKQSITTPAVQETPKLNTAEEITRRLADHGTTLEHINKATAHIRELSSMLYEAQDSPMGHLQDVARAVQDLMGTYADEIDECAEYFGKLVTAAGATHKSDTGK
jgi:hypothetical protein